VSAARTYNCHDDRCKFVLLLLDIDKLPKEQRIAVNIDAGCSVPLQNLEMECLSIFEAAIEAMYDEATQQENALLYFANSVNVTADLPHSYCWKRRG
jgi:hypothetical protein